MGRAIAAVLIVYSHIDALLLRTNENRSTWLTDLIDNAVKPLGLDHDAIGYVSVPFFFLVSGFVVTSVAVKVGSGKFAIKFVCRLFPLLIFAVVISVVVIQLGGRPLTTGQVTPVSAGGILGNIFLYGFLHKPIAALVGVSWSLLPEVTFYLLLMALIPLFRRMTWLAIAIELEVVFLVLMTRGQLGVDWRDFAANASYVTLALIGQATWAVWAKRIPVWLGIGYAAASLALYLWAANMYIDPDFVLPVRPVLYSVGLFVVGMGCERWLRQRPLWTALSERTYALYLLHGVVAFPIMFALYDTMPLWLDALVGIGAMFAVVEFAYRFVDRPMNNLGRRLSGSRSFAASRSTAARRAAPPASDEHDDADEQLDRDDYDEYDDYDHGYDDDPDDEYDDHYEDDDYADDDAGRDPNDDPDDAGPAVTTVVLPGRHRRPRGKAAVTSGVLPVSQLLARATETARGASQEHTDLIPRMAARTRTGPRTG